MALLGAAIGAGIARGAERVYERNLSDEAQARRAKARLDKERLDRELETEQANRQQLQEGAAQELQLLQQENRRLLNEGNKRATYDAFDRYAGDSDIRHLNVMLDTVKQNKPGQRMFGDIIRMDNITPQDITIVNRDLSNEEARLVSNPTENPELIKDIVKLTRADGSVKAARLSDLMSMTGYTRYADKRQLDNLRELAEIRRMGRGGATTATERQAARVAEGEGLEPGSAEYNARITELIAEATARPEQSERLSTRQEREAYRLTEGEGLEPDTPEFQSRFNEIFDEIVTRDRETTAQKELTGADEAINRLVERAGGEDEFFELDFSVPRIRRKYERDIEKLERLGKLELSAAEKKELEYINQLIALGEPGSTLTAKETGVIDRLVKDTKKYITDETEGIDATSAYAAFRNTIRHALFGSVLTEGEIKSFNEQFGTLKQQTGPILAQFRTALEQVRNKLETIVDTNNSYVMKFRTGKSQEELDRIIDALDDRIEAISEFSPTNVEPKATLSPERQAELEAILTGPDNED